MGGHIFYAIVTVRSIMNSYKPSFALLGLLVAFPQLSETIYTPALPELSRYFATSANMMQHSLSIYFLGFALGVFSFGRMCDLVGRKNSMLLGIFLYFLASASCALSPSISIFLVARFFQAMGASVGSVVTMTMIRDIYAGKERHQMFSSLAAIIALAPALGPFIGSQLNHRFAPMAIFWFLVLLGVMIFCTSATMLKETAPERIIMPALMPLMKRMLTDGHILMCSFFIAAHNGMIFSFHAEAPFIFMDMLELDARHYGLVGLFMAVAAFSGSMINKRLLKKYSPQGLHIVGAVIMTCSSAVLLSSVPLAQAMGNLAMQAVVLACTMSLIMGIGISLPNCLSISLKDYQNEVGSAGAIFGLMYYLLIGGFLMIMGTIHNGTLWPMPIYFLLLSSSMTAGAILMFRRMKTCMA